ncbi:hypothetical protein TNCV_3962181 [Trichonephila clavipes]|nr:hypothetical protein TNCV_3962181 [Trichonephila clavipes]
MDKQHSGSTSKVTSGGKLPATPSLYAFTRGLLDRGSFIVDTQELERRFLLTKNIMFRPHIRDLSFLCFVLPINTTPGKYFRPYIAT